MAQVNSENSTNTPNDPILAVIEAHRAAYVAYDQVAEGPDDENDAAFRVLDAASQRLMRAEASTLKGLGAAAARGRCAGAADRGAACRTLVSGLWDVLRERCGYPVVRHRACAGAR